MYKLKKKNWWGIYQ